jgi:hypothetical protein
MSKSSKPIESKTTAEQKPAVNDAQLLAPKLVLSPELRPALESELDPVKAFTQILSANKESCKNIIASMRQAHAEEPDLLLKPIKAFDILIESTFRLAAKGPEFILPAIVSFIAVAEKSKAITGVETPTLKEVFADKKLISTRQEIINAPCLLTSELHNLIDGSASHSIAIFPTTNPHQSKGKLGITFGVPLIQLGENLRLPNPDTPVENGILVGSFLALMEEAIHAAQGLRSLRHDREMDGIMRNFRVEEITCSNLYLKFLAEVPAANPMVSKLTPLQLASLEGIIKENDVVGKLVELSKSYNFPIECLSHELNIYHVEMRRDFIDWMRGRGLIPRAGEGINYYFKALGEADPIRGPNLELSEGAQRLVDEIARFPGGRRTRAQIVGGIKAILSQEAEFARLESLSRQISASQLEKVINNLYSADSDDLLPTGWIKCAQDSALAALAIQEYLRRIGYLKEGL